MSAGKSSTPLARIESFTARLGIRLPILLAPMAGACPPSLSIAVANAGGMGACGALLMNADAIRTWVEEFRRDSEGAFQLNLWVPDPPPVRNPELERRQREFLSSWGPEVPPDSGDSLLPDFDAQCQALLDAKPRAISSIMGLYPASFVAEMKARKILWFATATTVAEARAAEAAGADAIIAQGMEAGGHRGAVRCRRSRGSHGRIARPDPANHRRRLRARDRSGWNRRWPRRGGGFNSGSQRSDDRNWLPALAGGEDQPHTCRDARSYRGA